MRRCLLLVLLAATLRGETAPAPGAGPAMSEDGLTPEQLRQIELAFVELPPEPEAAPAKREKTDFASVIRFGEMRLKAGDYDSAMIAFQQAGKGTDRNTEREAALAGLARTYRQSGDLVKAAATYERLVADHAGTIDTPMYLLELGRTLRALGAPKLAIARFYSVLHSVLKVPPGEGERYRQIARTAQYEIAETHFEIGNYPEAARFFTRLNLLDLAPADRMRAEYKAALARARSGDHLTAIAAYREFISRFPEHELSAEARFQLATLLHGLGRRDEARATTLDLLRLQQPAAGTTSDHWTYWQRRTGNQLANDFYQQGDFSSAFSIYSGLAALGGEPRWRLPVLYQMGLCQERLLQTASAKQLYESIRQEAQQTPASPELTELARMAEWRLRQLEWSEHNTAQLDLLALPAQVALPAPDSPRS